MSDLREGLSAECVNGGKSGKGGKDGKGVNGGKGLNIGARSFINSLLVIFVLMVVTYVLTLVIPGGEYARVTDAAGNTVIDTGAGFRSVEGGLPFRRWLLSPFLVLTAEGGGTLIAVILFLIVIGGIFNALSRGGLMEHMLGRIVARYAASRYRLLALITLFFMAMGALIGSFEECVPLVPIATALALSLGWDVLTGLGMSLLAVGSGFASGVCNPFTVGVAQGLAGLPMFSGLWFRAIAFVLIYGLLMAFLIRHARRVDKGAGAAASAGDPGQSAATLAEDPGRSAAALAGDPGRSAAAGDQKASRRMDSGLRLFVVLLAAGIALVIASAFIRALQSYTMVIVAAVFLVAGVSATLVAGMKPGELFRDFGSGIAAIFPAIFMILMASSIKYTLTEGRILDTILHWAVTAAGDLPRWSIILFIYLIALVMNFFIASGSAKAFLLIPLIVPMARIFNIAPQLCIVAYAFGDGFSNVFYPTNPVLLISLGLAGESYGGWARWTWKFQALNLLLTGLILLAGLAIGYR